MTDISITSYEPGGDRAEFGVTVDGQDYTVYWYDNDGEPQFFGPDLGEREAEVRERIELFFTFYDHEALKAKEAELTGDALADMREHLGRNAAAGLAEDTVVTVHRSYLLRQHQSYDVLLKAGEHIPEDLDWQFDERVCAGTFLAEEIELIDNDELELEITGQRPASAPAWTP